MNAAKDALPVGIRQLSKHYGPVRAVDGVSFDIRAGEFVTMLGPSGSGKTSLLMMMAGFTRPTAGAILLGERDITRLPPHRRNIGMVFQNYALFPHMTVAENIACPLRLRGVGKAEAGGRVQMIAQRIEASVSLYPTWGAASALGVVLLALPGLSDRDPAADPLFGPVGRAAGLHRRLRRGGDRAFHFGRRWGDADQAHVLEPARRGRSDDRRHLNHPIGLAKQLIDGAHLRTLAEPQLEEQRSGKLCAKTADHAEGLAAANERRRPEFVGR